MKFEDLKITRQFLNAIEDAGYSSPTDIQMKAIPPIRSGQDLIGIAQTGTGKTAAYVLPLLQTIKYAQGDAPRCLILCPTKELVMQVSQQVDVFGK
jgi:ATP-dependent RNA helicase RhlE